MAVYEVRLLGTPSFPLVVLGSADVLQMISIPGMTGGMHRSVKISLDMTLWLRSVLESVYLIWFLAGHNIQILLVGITSVETSSGSRYHAGKGIR